jgi:membrane-associated PAP2 superfamily phosphatase
MGALGTLCSRWIVFSVFGLCGSLILFHWTDLDVRLEQHFYSGIDGVWAWDSAEPISRFLLYDGVKALLIVFALSALVLLVFDKWRHFLGTRRRPLLILAMSLLIVPFSVSILKAATNVPCPHDIVRFGGQLPYVDVLDAWPDGSKPEQRQRCFPAGHASGGFALLALLLFGRNRREKILIATGVLTLGWSMGIYKMAVGDHFLSHTLVSMFIGIFWVSCLAKFVIRSEPG